MRTYYAQLSSFTVTTGAAVLAFNNPVASGVRVLVRCVENTHVDRVTTVSYKLERFASLVTGGTALALEPGDTSPRIARLDSADAAPTVDSFFGAFVVPSSPTYDESFSVTSRDGAGSCRELDETPLVLRPGESAVLTLIDADAETTSVAVEVQEDDIP